MRDKTSVIRNVIEEIWHSDDLESSKLRLISLLKELKMKSNYEKNRLILNVNKTRFKTDLDRLAANCMLKFEGHGVI